MFSLKLFILIVNSLAIAGMGTGPPINSPCPTLLLLKEVQRFEKMGSSFVAIPTRSFAEISLAITRAVNRGEH